MKEIKLKQITKSGSEYRVALGNGTQNTFTSIRDANLFLGATNNFLTDKLHEVHSIYVDVWNCYQLNYFYFSSPRPKETNLYLIERELVEHIDAIRNLLNLSVERAHHINGNFFVFIHFLKIADSLDAVVRILAQINKQQNNANGIYLLDGIIRRILYTRHELDSYAKRSTTKLFIVVPTHISEDKSYTPDFSGLRIVA